MKALFALAFFVIPYHSFAQSWTLLSSHGYLEQKEELIHPLVYSDFEVGLGIRYIGHRDKFFAQISAREVTDATNRNNNHLSLLQLHGEFGYLFSTKISWLLTGMSLSATYDYARYSLNYEYPFWLTKYATNWNNRIDLSISDKWYLQANTTISIWGLLSHTDDVVLRERKDDYTQAYFHRDLESQFIGQFLSVSGDAMIYRDIGSRWHLGFGAFFSHFDFHDPQRLSSHRVSATIALKYQL